VRGGERGAQRHLTVKISHLMEINFRGTGNRTLDVILMIGVIVLLFIVIGALV
jgi:hypothetical protein